MRIARFSTVLITFLSATNADVQFTSPAAGATYPAGLPLTVTWVESGTPPLISDLVSYQLFLCAGGDDLTTMLQLAQIPASGQFTDGYQVVASIDPSLGASSPANA